jgi:sulfate transport system permease protein
VESALRNHTVSPSPLAEPAWVKGILIAIAAGFIGIMILLPVAVVFYEAFRDGIDGYLASFADPYTQMAIQLTFFIAAIVVPMNLIFGVVAAWAITKFRFPGKQVLITLIDLPFSVSPVIAGLIFVLLFGANSWLGGWLKAHDLPIIFAVPGLVLATAFVTFPFIARELIPLMQEQGIESEEAAIVLGASGWQTFKKVTLPNIRWGIVYGVLLCNARAMGEFGAVSVVSGHIKGDTVTIPLQVEMLYDEYHFVNAFAVASTLTLLAIVTLVVKQLIEWKYDVGR